MPDASITLRQFKLERAVLEVRYTPSFLIWDSVGRLWTQAHRKWPALKVIGAEPAKTIFTLDDRIEFTVELEVARVICHRPSGGLAGELDLITHFVGLVTDHLELEVFSRVGLRQIFFKRSRDRDEASAAVMALERIHLPKGPHFGIESEPLLPGYTVRYEGKGSGVVIQARAEGRKVDFDPPAGLEDLEPVHREWFGIVFDVDYFTTRPVDVEQFRAQDWINQAIHLVNRDSDDFLGGA